MLTSHRKRIPVLQTLKVTLLVCTLLFILLIGSYASTIVVIALIIWSLLGAKQAIQALSLVVLIKFLNPAIFPSAVSLSLWGWIAIAFAGARIIFDNIKIRSKVHPVLPWLFLYSFVVFIESVYFSHQSVVSIFKLLAFSFTTVIILLGFRVTALRALDWTPWFLGIWLAVTLLSIPTYFLPGIGFYRDGSGFQGLLNHPQTFAVFLVPMVAWLTGRLFFSPLKGSYWLYTVLAIAWSFLFFTRGRTALAAIVISFIVVFMLALGNRPEWRSRIRKGMFKPIMLLSSFALFSIFLLQPSLVTDSVNDFVLKRQEDLSLSESFERSRGFIIIEMWDNFIHNPMFGIGFGVAESKLHPFNPIIEPVTGLPLSAATEKANLPLAVLEETGIVGAAFFIPFLIALIRHISSKSDLVLPWVFFACLFTNVSEMIFFSPSGFGLYIWLLMGWATCHHWERKSVLTLNNNKI